MIGKYYPVSWAWRIDVDRLNDWLDKHDKENESVYKGDLGMEAEFYDLVYENSCDDFIWPHLQQLKKQLSKEK